MALVAYSESDSDSESNSINLQPARKLLKLPSPAFGATGNCVKAITEDCSDHQGRQRSFEHKRGNWPSLVSISHPLSSRVVIAAQVVCDILSKSGLEFHPAIDFHMSLSRTFVLLHHWIESFVDELRVRLSGKSGFSVCFDACNFLVNDEKTRSFLVLQMDNTSSDPSVEDLASEVDACLENFRGQTYYENPSFHVSLAWCLGDVTTQLSAAKQKSLSMEILDCLFHQFPDILSMLVHSVSAKIGNKSYEFGLL